MKLGKRASLTISVLVVAANPLITEAQACVIDPTANVDPTVACGAGATIGPGARVRSDVFVGAGTSIGIDAEVDDGAVIGSNSLLEEGSIVGTEAIVGDSVTLRAGARVDKFTVIGDGSIIGVGSRVKPSIMIFPDSTIPDMTTISTTGQASALTNHIAVTLLHNGEPVMFAPDALFAQPGAIAVQANDGKVYLAVPPCPTGAPPGLCSEARVVFPNLSSIQLSDVITTEIHSAHSTSTTTNASCVIELLPFEPLQHMDIIISGSVNPEAVGGRISASNNMGIDEIDSTIACAIISWSPFP